MVSKLIQRYLTNFNHTYLGFIHVVNALYMIVLSEMMVKLFAKAKELDLGQI